MSNVTLPLFLMYFQNHALVLSLFFIFLALGNVISFTRTCFYRKQNSVQNKTMRNYVETFHANIGHSLA